MCRVSGPAQLVVDHVTLPQDANERVVSAMDIGDRDDSIRADKSPLGSGPRVIAAEYRGDENTQQQ